MEEYKYIQQTEEAVLKVTEFKDLINELITLQEPIWVEGEVSEFKNWKDRWIYFSLKDEFSSIECNLPKYRLDEMGIELEDGMTIRVLGFPELKSTGRFTFNIFKIKVWGEGSLKKAYELLKKKLEEEGLFSRKREIPIFVEKIGLLTSKSGATIHDFKKNLKPFGFKIYFYDVEVEGENSVASIVEGINWFNKNMPFLDVIVIIRGGGSLEELQAFNNEILARAIFASKIPVICGIGHETDVPIASLVADVAVSTPTAVAHYLNKNWENLFFEYPYLKEKLLKKFDEILKENVFLKDDYLRKIFLLFERNFKEKLSQILFLKEKGKSLFKEIVSKFEKEKFKTKNYLKAFRQRLKKEKQIFFENQKRLIFLFEHLIQKTREKVFQEKSYLKSFSPEENLKRGYSIIFSEKGKIIKDAKKLKKGEKVKAKLWKGEFVSKVEKIEKNGKIKFL